VAGQSPENFYHFVFQNDVYAVTGGQPVPGGASVDYCGLATSAGYRAAFSFDDLEDLAGDLREIMSKPGPVLVVIGSNTVLREGPIDQTWESNARMPAALRSVRSVLAPDAE
jgi:phosphonopyruvate decarboxylase